MPPAADNTVLIENARLVFRNFAGKEGQYNTEGDRNFSVVLNEDVAKQMDEDGWNVKLLKAREGDEDEEAMPETPIIAVSVKYGRGRPPKIVLITSKGRTNLGEDQVEMLDWADIINVDLIIRPYHWTMSGNRSGIKAYLKTMFVTIQEDPLEEKYSVPGDS